MKKKILIIGSGGHSRVVIDTIEAMNFSIYGIIDLNYKKRDESILGYPVIGNIELLDKLNSKKFQVVIAIGDCLIRKKIFKKVRQMNFDLPNIIHPTSILSKKINLGRGIFINAGVIANAKSYISDNVIVNTGAIIEHEVLIQSHVNIGPGVKIGGRVIIGESVYIGIGCSIVHSINIGSASIIGAGSVIIRDIKKKSTVVGIPGKEIT